MASIYSYFSTLGIYLVYVYDLYRGAFIWNRLIEFKMIYLIGILTGLVLAILVLISVAYLRPSIERTINRTLSITKKKGKIIEPEDNEVSDWLKSLPKQ
jgi:ABC-type lipoprotein release transport system permease subunit